MSHKPDVNLLRRYWLFAGGAFVIAAATFIGQWASGG
jgi:hypothetical protein